MAPSSAVLHHACRGSSAPSAGERQILVLGLGNILLQDEGLGVRAVERLAALRDWPEAVTLLDGGTKGLELLPYLDGITHLLILDTVDAHQVPGSLVRLEDGDIPSALSPSLSIHQLGVQELLALSALANTRPQRITLLGLQPLSLGWGTELTAPIAAALARLVQAAANTLQLWLGEEGV